MNNTESLIYTILDAIIEECSYSFAPITRDEIIGRNGNELVRMARCIFVTELKVLGYSNVVIYSFLNRTQQSLDEIQGKRFPEKTTPWDRYVAYNAAYADFCKKFADEQILDIAYLFFFADEDWKTDSKIWDYMTANK